MALVGYLYRYKEDEAVTKTDRNKGCVVRVRVSNGFLEKILVDEALKQLPGKYGAILTLHYIKDMSMVKISRILGTPRATLYRDRKKAEKMLEKVLTKGNKSDTLTV